MKYFGKICTKHPELKGERYPRGNCVRCAVERAAQRQAIYPAKARDDKRRYVQENPERVQEAKRRWRQDNIFEARESVKRWARSNPAKVRASSSRRRARESNAAVPLTPSEQLRVSHIYAEAVRRTLETGRQHHVDHDKPLARGGLHHPDNLFVVTAEINRGKGARFNSTLEYLLS